MIKRENSFVEAMKFLRDRNNSLVEQHEEKVNQKLNETKEFKDNYYKIREDRVRLENFKNKILESCKDAEMATAIKAIFITALEAETLTDNGIILAEEMVTRWIEDEGGAAKIIRENRNKTYLLNRICDIVEEAALIDMKSILEADDEDEDDITKEEDEEEVDFDFEEEKDGKKEKEAEEVIDDPESGEEVDVKEEEDEEPDEDSNGNVTYGIEGEKDPADVDSDNDDDEEDEDKVSDEVEDAMETEEESEDEEDDDE
jgi:hypothetical protein